jgi:hypothetical protein
MNTKDTLEKVAEVANDTAVAMTGASILKKLNDFLKEASGKEKTFDFRAGYLQAITDAASAVTSVVNEKHSMKNE